jgi:choline-glycine betaine transporter
MKEKSNSRRTMTLWGIAFGVATTGFLVTWGYPALAPVGPIASLPFAVLALWLQRRLVEASKREPAPSRRTATPLPERKQAH